MRAGRPGRGYGVTANPGRSGVRWRGGAARVRVAWRRCRQGDHPREQAARLEGELQAVRAVCRHARRAVRSSSGEGPRYRLHAAAPGIIARPVADLVGVVGPAVLALLCVVAAVRVRHRAADGTAPAAVGDGDAPNDEPPDDGQCGDVARALRQARKRRHSPPPTSLP